MKSLRIVLFGIFVLVAMLSPMATFAQDEILQNDNAQIDDSENLDIVLSYETQSPKTKQFDLVADITSGIDSDRVVVEWTLPNGIKFADELESRYSRPTVRTGEVTQVRKTLSPQYPGTYEIEVVVTAVKADVNYISSDKIELTFNDSKEIVPLSDEYKNAKMIYQLGQIALYFGIIVFVVGVAYFLYRQIRAIRS